MVHHRDVREATTRPFKRCTGHRQEVCGLKWSGDGGPSSANLASGGNDNKVCIWDLRGSRRGASTSAAALAGEEGPGDAPLWKFHEHTAAVKALAWDPHVSGVLATGGGTQDKHIRFWNVINGSMLSELDTGSQVRPSSSPFFPPLLTYVLQGMQPDLVTNLTRTRLHTRVLINHCAEPNLYLEVSYSEHGRLLNGPHESGALPCYEPGRGNDRHGRWRRDSPVLERFSEKGEKRKGEGESA